ncbi:MAG: hypothetical protein V4607_07345, partial [Pseudomonadota bacterium]
AFKGDFFGLRFFAPAKKGDSRHSAKHAISKKSRQQPRRKAAHQNITMKSTWAKRSVRSK